MISSYGEEDDDYGEEGSDEEDAKSQVVS